MGELQHRRGTTRRSGCPRWRGARSVEVAWRQPQWSRHLPPRLREDQVRRRGERSAVGPALPVRRQAAAGKDAPSGTTAALLLHRPVRPRHRVRRQRRSLSYDAVVAGERAGAGCVPRSGSHSRLLAGMPVNDGAAIEPIARVAAGRVKIPERRETSVAVATLPNDRARRGLAHA